MRVVLQRVSRAEVRVGGMTIARIGRGLLVLVGFATTDRSEALEWMARKVAELRIFDDEQGKLNRSVKDVGGEVLVVSQFTLLADCRKGRRPSFTEAAPAQVSQPLLHQFVVLLKAEGLPVQSGQFGAMMEVELVNEGPVTIVLDR
jgi:D-tyrosyl-tRNA(Tyr) deacylase